MREFLVVTLVVIAGIHSAQGIGRFLYGAIPYEDQDLPAFPESELERPIRRFQLLGSAHHQPFTRVVPWMPCMHHGECCPIQNRLTSIDSNSTAR